MKYKSLKRIIALLLSYRPEWLREIELYADQLKGERQHPTRDERQSLIWDLERRRTNAAMYLNR